MINNSEAAPFVKMWMLARYPELCAEWDCRTEDRALYSQGQDIQSGTLFFELRSKRHRIPMLVHEPRLATVESLEDILKKAMYLLLELDEECPDCAHSTE